jgi:hypothetical protein
MQTKVFRVSPGYKYKENELAERVRFYIEDFLPKPEPMIVLWNQVDPTTGETVNGQTLVEDHEEGHECTVTIDPETGEAVVTIVVPDRVPAELVHYAVVKFDVYEHLEYVKDVNTALLTEQLEAVPGMVATTDKGQKWARYTLCYDSVAKKVMIDTEPDIDRAPIDLVVQNHDSTKISAQQTRETGDRQILSSVRSTIVKGLDTNATAADKQAAFLAACRLALRLLDREGVTS